MNEFPIASGPHTDLDYQWQHRAQPQLEAAGWTIVRAAGGYVALDPSRETVVLVHGLNDARRDFWASVAGENATLVFESGSVRFDGLPDSSSGTSESADLGGAVDGRHGVLRTDLVPPLPDAEEQTRNARQPAQREVERPAPHPALLQEIATHPYRDALRELHERARFVKRHVGVAHGRVEVRPVLYVSGIMAVVKSDDDGSVVVGHLNVVERLTELAQEQHPERYFSTHVVGPRWIDPRRFAGPQEWRGPVVPDDPLHVEFQDIIRHMLDQAPVQEPKAQSQPFPFEGPRWFEKVLPLRGMMLMALVAFGALVLGH